jgi:hypothetical protein
LRGKNIYFIILLPIAYMTQRQRKALEIGSPLVPADLSSAEKPFVRAIPVRLQLLAGRVGINCTLVYGWHNGVGHMWNEIQINGSWYHLDLTWCDNSMLIYNYFNVTDSVIKKSHQISQLYSVLSKDQLKSESVSFNFVLHNCNSVRDNYFRKRGIPVSSATNAKDQNIINQLVPLIKAGKTTAVFLIQDNFNATVQKMGSGELSQWLLRAALAAGKKPNSVEVKYVPDQYNSGVTATFSFH